ncbi:T9SS type A sorting domain-containing protein [Aequorivita echinoideorum]|uniref:T9SS type A sorting domain-containing protein n=1 Tax=Aequorivita echinoideorum TaxID=1549647 RepID=A0ABS5S4T0_9FLAO|nr:T9SS type A sorting domain-containing protein [Aequorivita echinoideorum]MBT0608225.1 T9SS type A sorting domain-containing protein [Aequorivita echinoideorum]
MKKLLLFIGVLFVSIAAVAQVVANQPSVYEICDDLPYDGYAIFDLTTKNPEIIGSQNPNNLQVSFHQSQTDAQAGTPTITNPQAYVNFTNPQVIYARLQDLISGDFDITNFQIRVNPTPTPNQPTPLEVCDDDNDGFSIFDLTEKDTEINNGDPAVGITYHETLMDAENGTFAIPSPYQNIIAFAQTIYARLDNVTGCYAIVELDLIVIEQPTINQPPNLFINEGDGDGFAIFDLTVNEQAILGNLNPADYSVSYYQSQADAQNPTLAIMDPTAYLNITNPQTIYVRVENFTTGCFTITSFEIATDEANPLTDSDDDGIANGDEDLNNNGNFNDDDTDGDGIPNYLDGDDDGDYVVTIDEITGIGAGLRSSAYIFIDTDIDGIENYLDNDDDGDGTLTINEDYNNSGSPLDDDTNNNGIPDFLDSAVFLSVVSNELSGLKLYPNPTSGIVTFQSSKLVSETSVEIYNVQGRLVFSEKIIPASGRVDVNISSLENSMYFVKISSEENSVVKKLVKE